MMDDFHWTLPASLVDAAFPFHLVLDARVPVHTVGATSVTALAGLQAVLP